jgi:hypothetical protein
MAVADVSAAKVTKHTRKTHISTVYPIMASIVYIAYHKTRLLSTGFACFVMFVHTGAYNLTAQPKEKEMGKSRTMRAVLTQEP